MVEGEEILWLFQVQVGRLIQAYDLEMIQTQNEHKANKLKKGMGHLLENTYNCCIDAENERVPTWA